MSFKNNNISVSDFSLNEVGCNLYVVTYTSPVTGAKWQNTLYSRVFINEVFKKEKPTKAMLGVLKKIIKSGIKLK